MKCRLREVEKDLIVSECSDITRDPARLRSRASFKRFDDNCTSPLKDFLEEKDLGVGLRPDRVVASDVLVEQAFVPVVIPRIHALDDATVWVIAFVDVHLAPLHQEDSADLFAFAHDDIPGAVEVLIQPACQSIQEGKVQSSEHGQLPQQVSPHDGRDLDLQQADQLGLEPLWELPVSYVLVKSVESLVKRRLRGVKIGDHDRQIRNGRAAHGNPDVHENHGHPRLRQRDGDDVTEASGAHGDEGPVDRAPVGVDQGIA
eukprot:scaffold685_cov281-Pinguiococcus_pyrenoidosus.AAC.4